MSSSVFAFEEVYLFAVEFGLVDESFFIQERYWCYSG